MKEFMMIFRTEKKEQTTKPTPEQMQASFQQWQDWIGGIAAQGKFIATNALEQNGRTVSAKGLVSDGPYVEVKEMVGGYILVKANNLDEAVALSDGCPTLAIGGTVEIRSILDLSAFQK